VTVYDRQTHALVKNMDRASRASNASDVEKNSGGSVDVCFGPKAPAGKEANWVPTDPQRGFELMFRVYGPKKEFFRQALGAAGCREIRIRMKQRSGAMKAAVIAILVSCATDSVRPGSGPGYGRQFNARRVRPLLRQRGQGRRRTRQVPSSPRADADR
jgi:Protein of unknown function (DUF1214)